jgi:hypothetical protein
MGQGSERFQNTEVLPAMGRDLLPARGEHEPRLPDKITELAFEHTAPKSPLYQAQPSTRFCAPSLAMFWAVVLFCFHLFPQQP